MDKKYTGLIYCLECEIHKDNGKIVRHKFKGRKERNNINYRCNYRLKYGKDKCVNDTMLEESYIDSLIRQQLEVIDMKIDTVDVLSVIDRIEVSKTRIEIFFKNLPIKSCYFDIKLGQLHYDTLNY